MGGEMGGWGGWRLCGWGLARQDRLNLSSIVRPESTQSRKGRQEDRVSREDAAHARTHARTYEIWNVKDEGEREEEEEEERGKNSPTNKGSAGGDLKYNTGKGEGAVIQLLDDYKYLYVVTAASISY